MMVSEYFNILHQKEFTFHNIFIQKALSKYRYNFTNQYLCFCYESYLWCNCKYERFRFKKIVTWYFIALFKNKMSIDRCRLSKII